MQVSQRAKAPMKGHDISADNDDKPYRCKHNKMMMAMTLSMNKDSSSQ